MRNFKKVIALFLVIVFMFSLGGYAEETPITVFVDGEQIEFDVEPITENDRTLVPMRFIFEALGAEVSWDDVTWTATAVKDDITISITIDKAELIKNGEVIVLDVPARLVDGRTLVPVRAVSEGLEAKVEWVEETKQVFITTVASSNEKDSYSYTELSENDMKALKEVYADMRYQFEYFGLPQVVFGAEEFNELLLEKSDVVKVFPQNLWNEAVTNLIFDMQLESKDNYTFEAPEGLSEDELTTHLLLVYGLIAEEADMSADQLMTTSFVELEDGSVMLLIEFSRTDSMLACKYIGIVASTDGVSRYFTAETDPMIENDVFLCEIKLEGRENYNIISSEKETFIDSVKNLIK